MLNLKKFILLACQYPNSDNIHFYLSESHPEKELYYGVNTLIRITFISTKKFDYIIIGAGPCQYPNSDNIHFYYFG